MTDTDETPEDDGWVRDPREGQGVLALWDFVYDFDSDVGGFITGQFLLRADGVLWIRTGSGRWSGPDTERHEYQRWRRWSFLTAPVDVAGAFAAVGAHHYTVYPPGPVPIDADEGGPYADVDRQEPLAPEDAHRWTAPIPRAAGRDA